MSISRPVASLATGGAGGSGLGGAVGSVIGGSALDLREAGVSSLTVELGTGTAHDGVEVVVSALSPLFDSEPGSTLDVALAATGEPTNVLSTIVRRVEDHPEGRRIVGLAPSALLSDLHLARTYVQQTVADVVEDVLATAEVGSGIVDAAHSMEQYHLDGRRTAWGNLHALARLFGAEITSEPDGAVSFQPAPGADAGGPGGLAGAAGAAAAAAAGALGLGDPALRRGANVLGWAVGPRRGRPRPTFAVAPLGAASTFGAPRGHHLLKEPERGGPTLVVPTLRNAAAADWAAAALTAGADRRRTGGRLRLPGDPGLRAGQHVTIDDETWHALRVEHRVDPTSGYVCELVVEGMAR